MNKKFTRFIFTSLMFGCCFNTAQASSTLESLKKETQEQLQHFASGELRCFPELKSEAEAHIIYSYDGVELVDENLGGSPPKYLDVRVEKTDKPVLLVFSAYDPVVWRVNVTSEANIAGVYMSGYYEQMVTGLPQGTPVTRTQHGFRNGKEHENCSYEESNGSILKYKNLSKEQVAKQLHVLRAEYNLIREEIRINLNKMNIYKETRDALANDDANAKALVLLDEKISNMLKVLKEAKVKNDKFQKQILLLQQVKSNFSQDKKHFFKKFQMINSSRKLKRIEKILKEEKSVSVASFQWLNNPHKPEPTMVVSKKSAEEFNALKASGLRKLNALDPPKFDLVDLDKPHLAAPSDYVASAGLDYLVKKGYLIKDDRGPKYYCAIFNALHTSNGIIPKVCHIRKEGYTIVGPIVFPSMLCGSDSVTFFMPPGAPQPEGNSCHSNIRYYEELHACRSIIGTCLDGRPQR